MFKVDPEEVEKAEKRAATVIEQLKKISKKILFGDENPEIVMKEIAEGKRPANWNVPNHPDHAVWVSFLARKAGIEPIRVMLGQKG